MTTITADAPVLDAHHPGVHADFLRDVTHHEMTVLHDDGLYRHLRFAAPGPDAWHQWFELVTWPGNLIIGGDMGSYGPFARHGTADMVTFFESSAVNINPDYWAEKLPRDHADVKEYDPDVARKAVWDYWAENADEFDADEQKWIAGRIEALLDYHLDFDAADLHSALDGFNVSGFAFSDVHEIDVNSYTFRFLWCCFAIRWGISQYRATAEQATV